MDILEIRRLGVRPLLQQSQASNGGGSFIASSSSFTSLESTQSQIVSPDLAAAAYSQTDRATQQIPNVAPGNEGLALNLVI